MALKTALRDYRKESDYGMIEDWFDIWFFDEAYDLYKGGYTREHLEEAYYAGWQKSKQVNMAIREIGVLSEFEDVN